MPDDPDLHDVIDRELRLHDPAVRSSSAAAGELLDPDFHEFGASGRSWDRASILDMMATRDAPPPIVEDLTAIRLADDVVLLTYRSRTAAQVTLRSSLWRRRTGGPWRIYFHQGTPTSPHIS